MPGKKKQEKRLKQYLEETKGRSQDSAMQAAVRQAEVMRKTGKAFVVLEAKATEDTFGSSSAPKLKKEAKDKGKGGGNKQAAAAASASGGAAGAAAGGMYTGGRTINFGMTESKKKVDASKMAANFDDEDAP